MPDSIDVFMVGGPDGDWEVCSSCGGLGLVPTSDVQYLAHDPELASCPTCLRTGFVLVPQAD